MSRRKFWFVFGSCTVCLYLVTYILCVRSGWLHREWYSASPESAQKWVKKVDMVFAPVRAADVEFVQKPIFEGKTIGYWESADGREHARFYEGSICDLSIVWQFREEVSSRIHLRYSSKFLDGYYEGEFSHNSEDFFVSIRLEPHDGEDREPIMSVIVRHVQSFSARRTKLRRVSH